jgi:hypothetical protein
MPTPYIMRMIMPMPMLMSMAVRVVVLRRLRRGVGGHARLVNRCKLRVEFNN